MATKLLILLGTKKGLFILESDAARRDWAQRGPYFEAWPICHAVADPRTGTIHAGGGNEWFGPAVWTSADLGATWFHSSEGLAYAPGEIHTADGGDTWQPRNSGIRCNYLPEGQRYLEYGQCVHGLAMAPGMPNRLYQQNHCGMYRSDDGGRSWLSIEAGLPSSFDFPAAAHPRDPETLYLLPLNGDTAGRYVPDAKAAVWRTRDRGESWQALRDGLPQRNAFFGVLRQAMATDPLSPAGVYFGTGSGSLFASADEGESWTCIAQHLPAISSVETLLVGA
jgi:photosystem II stability/assembly factor-like uncharacterized protein